MIPPAGVTPIYTQQPTDGSTPPSPLHTMIDGGRMLVSALHTDRGDGNFLTTTYQYEGLAIDQTGRGEQGFERVTITNPQGTVHSTQFAQGFPFTGMELSHTITASSANNNVVLEHSTVPNTLWAISTTLNTGVSNIGIYAPTTGYDTAVYPFVKDAQVARNDLNGVGTTNTDSTVANIDNWGNVTASTVYTAAAGTPLTLLFETATANTYINNPQGTPYVIGQLVNSSVTKTAPNQAPITRTKQFDYYGQTQAPMCAPASFGGTGAVGLLMDEISECYPSGPTALSVQTTYNRDNFGNINKTTQSWIDPVSHSVKSRASSTTYEAQGRFPQTVTNALNQSASVIIDDRTGAKTSATDINNLMTTWNVNGFGRTLSEIHPDNTETDYYQKQCAGACPITTADPGFLGNTDPALIPVTVTITDHVLKGGGIRIAVPELNFSDSAGHHLRNQSYGFDGTEIDTDFTYDQYGRADIVFQPTYTGTAPVIDHRQFADELNRIIDAFTFDEAGAVQTTSTVYNGLTTTVKNPLGQTKTSTNNAIGQLVQTIDANGNATNFTRDAVGNLTTTTDSAGNVVTIQYDNLGRKVSLQDPDLGLISYGIDPIGQQYQQINPNERAKGQSTTFAYDALGRMTQRIEPDMTANWVFDQPTTTSGQSVCIATQSCGKLIEAYTVASAAKDYDRLQTYDNLGRPSSTATTLYNGIYTSTNAYDSYGRASTIQHQPGTGIPAKTYAQYYNGNGYLAQVARIDGTTGNTSVLWQANKQDAADRVTHAALGNGLQQTRDYYQYTARLQDANLTSSTGAVLQEGYSYDVLGNVSSRSEYWGNGQGFTEGFTYDPMNRLASSSVSMNTPTTPTTVQSFQYNDIGNLIDKTGVGSCTGTATAANPCYAYPASGPAATQPHAVSTIPGLGSFQYDANGNMTSGAGRTETWNSFDMPIQITGGNNSSSQFVYGPEHQRTRQVSVDGTTGNTTQIVYAGAMEADISSGNATIKTYWPMGLGVEIDAPNAATKLNWTHADRLGSIVAITDASGNLEENMAYDAWGARRDLVGDAVTTSNTGYKEIVDNKGFTGQEELDKLALVHLNGRVYDPFTARFLSADPEIQDPTHSQSYNRFTYVWNNPTNMTDPTGFSGENPGGGAGSEQGTQNLYTKPDGMGSPAGVFANQQGDNTNSSGSNGTGCSTDMCRVPVDGTAIHAKIDALEKLVLRNSNLPFMMLHPRLRYELLEMGRLLVSLKLMPPPPRTMEDMVMAANRPPDAGAVQSVCPDCFFLGPLRGLLAADIFALRGASSAGSLSSVWDLAPTARGTAIEANLAQTEYADWFNVGQLDNGKFPLVDFQKGNTLASLKSVDTTGSSWMGRMEDVIEELNLRRGAVDGNPANMILDLRVQPGGFHDAQPLIDYGAARNVPVLIKEFP